MLKSLLSFFQMYFTPFYPHYFAWIVYICRWSVVNGTIKLKISWQQIWRDFVWVKFSIQCHRLCQKQLRFKINLEIKQSIKSTWRGDREWKMVIVESAPFWGVTLTAFNEIAVGLSNFPVKFTVLTKLKLLIFPLHGFHSDAWAVLSIKLNWKKGKKRRKIKQQQTHIFAQTRTWIFG